MKAEFTSLRTGCNYSIEMKANVFNGFDVHVEKQGGMTGCYIGKVILVFANADAQEFPAIVNQTSEVLHDLKFN